MICVATPLRTGVDADAVLLEPICPDRMLEDFPLFQFQHSIMQIAT
jgi:hypothetical protein